MATPRQYLISIQHFIQHLFAIQCYLLKVVFLKALLYRRFEVAYYSMQPHNGDDDHIRPLYTGLYGTFFRTFSALLIIPLTCR